MATVASPICPVVGTTNTVLPPTHPEFDISQPGQKCPVTNATTDHHQTLQKHPSVPGANNDASQCPALSNMVKNDPVAKKIDEGVCPVVGVATTVLPPKHPAVEGKEDVECPVTKAKVGHHQGKVAAHPKVTGTAEQCPVVGAKA